MWRVWQLYASLEASQGPRDRSEPSRASTADPSQLEPDDPSRRAAAKRPARQVDVARDASRVTTAGVDGVTAPAPYGGQPFAPIGALSAAEHACGRGLVQRGWPELGWAIKGRDGAGHLVAAAVLPCGAGEPGMERHCYQTLTPDGLVYRTLTVPIAPPRAP